MKAELATITKQAFLTEYSVPNVARLCSKVKTCVAAVESGLPSLSRLKKEIGEQATQAYIEAWIVNLCEFVNLGQNITEMQIFETAALILSEYPVLNLADVNLIFRRAKTGKYGTLFNRLDGLVILSWFDQYFQERCREMAEKSMDESDRQKAGLNRGMIREAENLYNKTKM